MITSVVNIGDFIVIIYFVCFFHMEIDIFYVSKKNNLWFIFNLHRSKFNMSATKTLYDLFLIICYLLWAYISLGLEFLRTLILIGYIASLFNFDRNGHVDVVCMKLK